MMPWCASGILIQCEESTCISNRRQNILVCLSDRGNPYSSCRTSEHPEIRDSSIVLLEETRDFSILVEVEEKPKG